LAIYKVLGANATSRLWIGPIPMWVMRAPAVSQASGRRDYDEEVFANLHLIRMALESGFTINQARTLIHGFSAKSSPPQRWRTLATKKLKEIGTCYQMPVHFARRLWRSSDDANCISWPGQKIDGFPACQWLLSLID
jgi:hypothetical protein